jgi:3-deoxy-7-phosphoheptulonate synthase
MDSLLTEKRGPEHKSEITIAPGVSCGGKQLLIIAGPCAVESVEQMEASGEALAQAPVQALRGGVFKPRTSPYSFQGLGAEGAMLLRDAGKRHGLPVVSEVMSHEQLPTAVENFDVLQIGSRNMQNFELLKSVGKLQKPVLLKRGLAATIEEFIMAAEYIVSNGNPNVILCERGIRSFDPMTRNVLDLGAVVTLKRMTHLPIIVDPSHAAGRSELVADLARAAVACGADGVMIECHPQPLNSVSDARQALSLIEMTELVVSLSAVAKVVGREVALGHGKSAVV